MNEHGVRYAVIGGFAIQNLGFARPTQDIDLLIDSDAGNIARVRDALAILADAAVRDLRDGDVEAYGVVRVVDEVVVDLMRSACGVTLADAERDGEVVTGNLDGVPVRYLSARALLRTKQTVRGKDEPDRQFLEWILSDPDAGRQG